MPLYDLLLTNGKVVDPANDIEDVLDVAIRGSRIAEIKRYIPHTNAAKVEDVSGCLVFPGLIDLHTHVYYGGAWGINADTVGPKTGVTTFVDCGSVGSGNFPAMLQYVIKPARVRIFSFLHVAWTGLEGSVYDPETSLTMGELLDLKRLRVSRSLVEENTAVIRGLKIRVSKSTTGKGVNGIRALHLALQIAEDCKLPLMVHIGSPPPTRCAILTCLRKGDVLTHAFRGDPNGPLNKNGSILRCMYEARRRGVLMDLGHGRGGFSFPVAKSLLKRGFMVDVISSDLHVYSIDGPAHDLPTTMSKMLNLGMPLKEVVRATTETPARILGKSHELGSLGKNRVADISVFKLEKGDFTLQDGFGNSLKCSSLLVPFMTIREGTVIWKRNPSNIKGGDLHEQNRLATL